MESVAIYARYSSDKQKSESIEQQVSVCTDYCKSKGYDVVEVYTDKAMSGRSDDRPSFQRMVKESSMYDAVVVYKFDRFARNRYDSALYRRELKNSGCRLESATENTGDGIESIILESLLDGMAEYYSAALAQRTTLGMENNAQKCKVNGMLPYGYENVNGHYSIVPHEADVVRRIFATYADNEPFDFEQEFGHLTTRRGKKFTPSIVSQMLRNERYIGVYKWGDTRIEGGVPRIVSDELWNAVHARINKRRKRTMKSNMLLTGKLFGKSGEHSQTQGTKTKYGEYQYYVVDGQYIERSEIEGLVASSVRSAITDEENLEKIISIVLKEQSERDATNEVCDTLEASVRDVQKEKANYIEAIGKMGVQDALVDAVKDCDRRISGFEKELEIERKRMSAMHLDETKIRIITERMADCMDDGKLIANWVSYVVVFDDHITVYCNWDKKPATEAAIAAAITSDDGVRVQTGWCPRYELARTTCNTFALIVISTFLRKP